MSILACYPDLLGHVASTLRRSGELGSALVERLDTTVACIHLLADLSPAVGTPLDVGGVCGNGDSLARLVDFTASELQQPDSLAVFFNECARRDDPIVSRYEDAVFCGSEVYHCLTCHATRDQIVRCIRDAETSVYLVGAITSQGLRSNIGRATTIQTVHAWANLASSVIIGAFDGESYLVWPTKRPCC